MNEHIWDKLDPLYKRHAELIIKKFNGGLEYNEIKELLDVRKEIDELEVDLILDGLEV